MSHWLALLGVDGRTGRGGRRAAVDRRVAVGSTRLARPTVDLVMTVRPVRRAASSRRRARPAWLSRVREVVRPPVSRRAGRWSASTRRWRRRTRGVLAVRHGGFRRPLRAAVRGTPAALTRREWRAGPADGSCYCWTGPHLRPASSVLSRLSVVDSGAGGRSDARRLGCTTCPHRSSRDNRRHRRRPAAGRRAAVAHSRGGGRRHLRTRVMVPRSRSPRAASLTTRCAHRR